MTEPTPGSAHLGPEAEAPVPRRRFVLARLATALRRQDWVTVLVEIVVVILGVVIGFQVTAWGQDRTDRAREQDYLRQLVQDLRETERRVEAVGSSAYATDLAAAALLRAFRAPEPPPRDSLFAWGVRMLSYEDVQPVLGTAEALVATGDLVLIRDDSVRAHVTAYVDEVRNAVRGLQHSRERATDAANQLREHFDTVEAALVSPDSVYATLFEDARSPVPDGADPSLFPFTSRGFLSSRGAYVAVEARYFAHRTLRRDRDTIREATRALRSHLETQIER